MRLPFLQLESDLLAHGAGSVAVLLGCSDVEALGHIALMRAWAVSRASDEAAPDGWVPGDNAARLVASGARWRGDPMAFIAALADPGVALLEVHRDGIRVMGLEPYAEAWDKNAKARERLKKYRERNAHETRTFDARNANVSGQTQTQTQKEASSTKGTAPPSPGDFELTSPAGKKQRQPSAAERLFDTLQATRKQRCEEVGEEFVEEHWPHARRNRDLKPILEAEEGARSLFEAAWGLYLADDGERVREPAWSLSWFMSSGVRARYETRAAREGEA